MGTPAITTSAKVSNVVKSLPTKRQLDRVHMGQPHSERKTSDLMVEKLDGEFRASTWPRASRTAAY